jgi:hypothetical protein
MAFWWALTIKPELPPTIATFRGIGLEGLMLDIIRPEERLPNEKDKLVE